MSACEQNRNDMKTNDVVTPINPRRAPKSRNGCLRCKSKRLKCDERKPECAQCNKKSLPCPGYKTKTLVWSTKHEKLLSSKSAVNSPPESLFQSTGDFQSRDAAGEVTRNIFNHRQDGIEEVSLQNAAYVPEGESLVIPQPSQCRESEAITDSLSAIKQQLHRSTVPEFLHHLPTMLVEYYFSYVCRIFSSFDGTLNPFRSTVGRLWDGSAPIYYAIQSMAAAYLSNHFPRMNQVGLQMQRETYRCLYQNQQGLKDQDENLDKTLLTVLLVGQTTAWHDTKDLGVVHLKTAKRINRRRIEQQNGLVGVRERRQNAFFEQCILYWEMLVGFVKDDVDDFGSPELDSLESTPSLGRPSPSTPEGQKELIFPHPWTGVAPTAQDFLAQVGRLIRSHRRTQAEDLMNLDFLALDLTLPLDLPSTSPFLAQANTLEEKLLAFEPPTPSQIVDAGDLATPVHQYIALAESYRCAALLQIYRVFPSLLNLRIPSPYPFLPTTSSPQDFLLSLALHTIFLLESIPLNSGTRCLQPLILIIAASELIFPDPLAGSSITSREIEVASARRFVVGRFQEWCTCMPAKPLRRALVIVEETWRRCDGGEEVFWMDVMGDLGGGTIFG
ncbi:Zn2/Cys6 DNA-binding protein [Glarea lozoyensis ATCC 20868]|uniref:Zn2/Cys6 DNA-binding protein n=1 Tax=Glarea lozoyensis (strain ATCC 20868 / MF5171) TaxID=1116229 RepID=S3DXQ8_GLAL2|nr:Zn2/Cys6 DNA-binding protein [Glarea lozoyensis ATCC 20868]EPE31143.1 Zn2/Cys6 DNA-binding protein [Glarea lozoyensis ATCC 20868]